MKNIKINDKVLYLLTDYNVIFEVKKIYTNKDGVLMAVLKGISERIEIESEVKYLKIVEKKTVEKKLKYLDEKIERLINDNKRINENRESRLVDKIKTGKILHLDGDRRYSEKSQKYYQKMNLNAVVKNIQESRQPKLVYGLLRYYMPDIVIITGHDGMYNKERGLNDIYNYRNSKYFIETVKEVRRFEKMNNVNISIFAGACQSFYEALIMAGANFASSPARILIDFLDPLIIAERIATTDYKKYITIDDIKYELRDGKQGIDGIGTNRKEKITM